MNNIFEENNKFYYYDESDDTVGPFDTLEQAEISYQASLKWHVRDHKNDIRKMRDYYD